MSKEQSKLVRFLSGKGFYVALAICLVGAGASAWVAVDRSIHNITQQDPASYLSGGSSVSISSSAGSPTSEEVGKEQSDVSKPSPAGLLRTRKNPPPRRYLSPSRSPGSKLEPCPPMCRRYPTSYPWKVRF